MSRNLLLICLMLGCTQVIFGLEVNLLRVKRTGSPALDPFIKSLPFIGQMAAGNVRPATQKPSAPLPNPAGQILSALSSGQLEPGTPLFNTMDKLLSGLPGSLCGRGSVTLPSVNVDDLLKLINNGNPLNTLGQAMNTLQGAGPQGGKLQDLPALLSPILKLVCGLPPLAAALQSICPS